MRSNVKVLSGGALLAVAVLTGTPASAQVVAAPIVSPAGTVSASGGSVTVTVEAQCPMGYTAYVEAYVFQRVGKYGQIMGEREGGSELACTGQMETLALTVSPFAEGEFRQGRADAAATIRYWNDADGGEIDSPLTRINLKDDHLR